MINNILVTIYNHHNNQDYVSIAILSPIEHVTELNRHPVYLLFYHSVLPIFSAINKFLQYEEPKIHIIRSELIAFIKKIFGRFIFISVFKDKLVTEINLHDSKIYLSDHNMMIGFTTRLAIKKYDILPLEEAIIIKGCKSFFIAACEYAISHPPINDDLLLHAEILNFKNKELCFDSIIYFIPRFSA